jgi:hypothetical protein
MSMVNSVLPRRLRGCEPQLSASRQHAQRLPTVMQINHAGWFERRLKEAAANMGMWITQAGGNGRPGRGATAFGGNGMFGNIQCGGATVRRGMIAAAIAALAGSSAMAAGNAVADEVQVSTSNTQNVEFDESDGLLQWVDKSNNLWAAGINRATGAFIPQSAQGVIVDTNVATSVTFGNGPEWVVDTSGTYLVYTKYQPGTAQNKSASTAFAATAKLTSNTPNQYGTGSVWQVASMPNTLGLVEPEGNYNPSQANPPIVLVNGSSNQLYLQGINSSSSVAVPGTTATLGSQRMVTGENALIYTAPGPTGVNAGGNPLRQAFVYNIGSGVTTQLTSDAGNKGDVFMFRAPEYNNAYVLMISSNATTLRFYTLNPSTNTWTLASTLNNPSGAPPFIWSPEPFVYNGKTYIYFERSSSGNPTDFSVPTQVWVAAMDNSYNAQVSDPTITNRVRQDPKYFVTSNGVYIYYQEYTPATSTTPTQPTGVWRSNSGIPLATQPAEN